MSPHPPPIGALSAGLRYQVRYFWMQALPMLYASHVAKVVVEHRGVEAVDDVVVYYAPPGIDDRGKLVDVDFTQVKFHVVEDGDVDHDLIVDPGWTGTRLSLLKRFSDAWVSIREEHTNPRLTLVTNWAWKTDSPIRRHLREGGCLDEAFFTKGATTGVGRIRAKWQEACGLGDGDFRMFMEALRFSVSAVSQADAEEWLRDRCQLAGLVAIDPSKNWSPYDDLGMRLIESGRTEYTPETLRRLVAQQGLVQETTPPFRSTLAVRSFWRFAHELSADGARVIDLTDLFSERRAINDEVWGGEIKRRIEAAMASIEKLDQPIHIAFDAHLSIAWYLGTQLGPKSGISVLLRQKGVGMVQLWSVSTPRRPDGALAWNIAREEIGSAPDLAVVVSVTHDALADAKRSINALLPSVGTIIHLRLPQVGPSGIVDGAHARWLSDELVRAVRDEVSMLRPGRIHVFPASPVSLMFLLGQQAAAIGPMTVYEFAFGDSARTYLAGMAT